MTTAMNVGNNYPCIAIWVREYGRPGYYERMFVVANTGVGFEAVPYPIANLVSDAENLGSEATEDSEQGVDSSRESGGETGRIPVVVARIKRAKCPN